MSPTRLHPVPGTPVGLLRWGRSRGLEDRTASGDGAAGVTERAGRDPQVVAHVGGTVRERAVDVAELWPRPSATFGDPIVAGWTPLVGWEAVFSIVPVRLGPDAGQIFAAGRIRVLGGFTRVLPGRQVVAAWETDRPDIELVVDKIRQRPPLAAREGWIDCTGRALALVLPTAACDVAALDGLTSDLVDLADGMERLRLPP